MSEISISRRRFSQFLLASGAVAFGGLPTLARAEVDEGIDYRLVNAASTPDVEEGQIELVEVFWYGCPHCNAFQPVLTPWLAELPDDVVVRHIPAPFNPTWALHARAHYAASDLGILDEFHPALFAAIHDQRRNLNTEASLGRFAAVFEVDSAEFVAAMQSPEVIEQVARDEALVRRWGIDGVPSLVIDGRAVVSAGQAASHQRMIEIAETLIERRRAEIEESVGESVDS